MLHGSIHSNAHVIHAVTEQGRLSNVSTFHDRVATECGLMSKTLSKEELKECHSIADELRKCGLVTEAMRVRSLGARLVAIAHALEDLSYDAMGETQPIHIKNKRSD